MKTILVTGGNRGIGLEICRQLDSLGHRVIMGSRDPDKGLAAARSLSSNVVVRQLDVTDDASILALAKAIRDEFGKLDVLINNAGIGSNDPALNNPIVAGIRKTVKKKFRPVWNAMKQAIRKLRRKGILAEVKHASATPLDKVKYIMETNFYGPWRMVREFLPLLENSNDPRIINVSSGMGQLKSLKGYSPGYSLSKSSLNALTILLSNDLAGKGIKVNAMCPGWVRTDMGGPDAPRDVSQGADTAVWLATSRKYPNRKILQGPGGDRMVALFYDHQFPDDHLVVHPDDDMISAIGSG